MSKQLLSMTLIALLLSAALSSAPAPFAVAARKRKPPKGALVLFRGKNLDQWVARDGKSPPQWKIEDGVMTAAGGYLRSKQRFTDFHLHLEFWVPHLPDKQGQARGNSGIYLQGRYEIQILDSYGIEKPGKGDCGALYRQAAPLVNACKPPDKWQSYDIHFRMPRVDSDGRITEPGRLTAFQNGKRIHENVAFTQTTGSGFLDKNHGTPGPIVLQFHGDPVRYRNVWIVTGPPKL